MDEIMKIKLSMAIVLGGIFMMALVTIGMLIGMGLR